MKKNRTEDCLICNRIQMIKTGKNLYFVKELETGYVVIGDYQFYKGYTLFLCKTHTDELHKLKPNFRKKFLEEMALVAEAVYRAFNPRKLNYELLGNTDSHLHWHLFPRYNSDPDPKRAVWVVDRSIRCTDETRPGKKDLSKLKSKLLKFLNK